MGRPKKRRLNSDAEDGQVVPEAPMVANSDDVLQQDETHSPDTRISQPSSGFGSALMMPDHETQQWPALNDLIFGQQPLDALPDYPSASAIPGLTPE